MDILIAAVGRMPACPERAIMDDYLKRLRWKVACKEIADRKNLPAAQRKAEESAALLEALQQADAFIALDEHDDTPTSREFAHLLGKLRDQGARTLGFAIGGAEGLSQELLAKARARIALGRLTWPHLLVRPLLAEQLYRAYTILTNHPYHRD